MMLGASTHSDFQPSSWRNADQDSPLHHQAIPQQLSATTEPHPLEAEEMSSRPIDMLRPKASSASISSYTSTSSNTTAQTFMTSFSFSTITGSHDRSATQEDLLSSSAGSYSSTGVPALYGENYDEGRENKEVDVESLDIAITTPTDNIHINPFDYQHDPVLQLQSSTWSKGHNKSFSQQSAVTIKGRQFGGSSSNMAAAVLPSPLTSSSSAAFRQQVQRVDEETAKDAEDTDGAAEDMMFASPDYRKSVSLSDHSDLALDPSSPPGETSSGNISEIAQYTNLLRDATTIIEQQHLQDHITSKPLVDHESDGTGIDSNNVHYGGYLRHNAEPSIGSSCNRDMRSSSRISDAGSTAEKTSVSSGRNTLRSQSRRFSAPGHPGTSHTSSTSISNASEASQASTESTASQSPVAFLAPVSGSRGPQSFVDNDEPSGAINRMHLPGLYSNNSHLAEGTSFKRAFHPPQHHTTMQAYTEKESAAPESSVVTSSAAQHQPHLHRDYRPGVVFEYYEGEWDWLPNFDEMRPDNVGIVGNFMIDDTTEQDLFRARYSHQTRRQFKESGNFAVRFTTYIDIIQDGVYSFWLSSNDGSVLYVSNRLVVENDGMHYATEAEGRIMLQAGKHAMTVEFFHKNGKMLEGFRSTGPSLIVSYRAPGPIWSFGLKPGPKKIIKSNNLFFDHGDVRLKNLLREFGVDDDSSMENNSHLSSNITRNTGPGVDFWPPATNDNQQNSRRSRYRVASGDMGHLQPSARELNVQMENAKATIRDLEQIIRDQADSHKKKMAEMYSMLQDTQAQVDRMVAGLKKATLFETPRTTITPNFHLGESHPSTWRNTVMSVYVDAQEDYPLENDLDASGQGDSGKENATDSDDILAKHIADVEKLKQLYFFSMALSVKMNSEMMGKKTPEYTSTSVQKLYEDCAINSKVPVEGWPGALACLMRGMQL